MISVSAMQALQTLAQQIPFSDIPTFENGQILEPEKLASCANSILFGLQDYLYKLPIGRGKRTWAEIVVRSLEQADSTEVMLKRILNADEELCDCLEFALLKQILAKSGYHMDLSVDGWKKTDGTILPEDAETVLCDAVKAAYDEAAKKLPVTAIEPLKEGLRH